METAENTNRPSKEFCKDVGCGALDEEGKCHARECPYPKNLIEDWYQKQKEEKS